MTITKQQLELRRNAIGSSDAPVIVGASPWKTPLALWLEKRNGPEPDEPSLAMEIGNALESYVADRWSRDTGHAVREVDTIIDKHSPFIIGHPDRMLVNSNEGLEVKVVGMASDEWGPQGSDIVPLHVHVQCDHLLMVSGAQRWHVAALLGMRELRHYVIERDEALLARLRLFEHQFWHMVQEGVQPPMMNAEDARRMYPVDSGTPITATPGITQLIGQLRHVRSELDGLNDLDERLSSEVQAYMGPNAVLVDAIGNKLATFKTSKDGSRLDTAALAKDHPDLIKRYTVAKPGSRRFILSKGDTT